MQTTTASDLAALDAALAREALAQARAERRAATLQESCAVGLSARYATCKPGLQVVPAARYAQAQASVGEALL